MMNRTQIEGLQAGVDYWIRYLAYADDLAILADDGDKAQAALNNLDKAAGRLGLVINVQKTKVMGPSPEADEITLHGNPVENVTDFTYLGSKVTQGTISPASDIECRIGKATIAFARFRKCLWARSDISLQTKMKIYRTVIIPTLLYTAEAWRLLDSDIQCLEVFQMRKLRELAGVSMSDRLTNVQVRTMCDNQQPIRDLIQRARLRWFGHVCRMEPHRDPLRMVFEPIPTGWKTSRTAPKKLWLNQVEQDLDFMKKAYGAAIWRRQWLQIARDQAQDRVQWRHTVQQRGEDGQPTAVTNGTRYRRS
jgi:hypothetical protein